MTSLAPYTAVLLASYGGPYKSEDVLPFMRNATAGRGIPDERLVEVSQHYELFGGRSPINERNAELIEAIREELGRRRISVPIAYGNRNWHPFHAETVAELAAAGHERVLALATSAYHSYSNCRQYREDLDAASASVDGRVHFDKIGAFAETDGFVAPNARALAAAVVKIREQIGDGNLRVLFVTHSIPTAMNANSGDGSPGSHYDEQTRRVAERVAAEAASLCGEEPTWELTYCSRSGAPQIPWLEPDVNDRMAELPGEGVVGVVTSPIGFLNDHMEVLYDLDTQARETADEVGLAYVRAATVGTDPDFVAMLVDELLARAAVARGEADDATTARYLEAAPCCQPPNRPHH